MTARFADAAGRAAHAAARLLGWRPAEFWAATPAELRTCLGQDAGIADAKADAPADSGQLARMMERYPDAERSCG